MCNVFISSFILYYFIVVPRKSIIKDVPVISLSSQICFNSIGLVSIPLDLSQLDAIIPFFLYHFGPISVEIKLPTDESPNSLTNASIPVYCFQFDSIKPIYSLPSCSRLISVMRSIDGVDILRCYEMKDL